MKHKTTMDSNSIKMAYDKVKGTQKGGGDLRAKIFASEKVSVFRLSPYIGKRNEKLIMSAIFLEQQVKV